MTRHVTLVALSIALPLLLGGCYGWAPLPDTPQPGDDVQAHLTSPGAVRLAERTGETERSIRGRLVDWSEESAVITRPRADLPGNPLVGVGADTLHIPLSDVAAWEGQRLSVVRTGAFVLAMGAVGYGVLKVFLDRSAGGGVGTDKPPPPALRIPIGVPLLGGQ